MFHIFQRFNFIIVNREYFQFLESAQSLDPLDLVEAEIQPDQINQMIQTRDLLDEVVVQKEPGDRLEACQVLDPQDPLELQTQHCRCP